MLVETFSIAAIQTVNEIKRIMLMTSTLIFAFNFNIFHLHIPVIF